MKTWFTIVLALSSIVLAEVFYFKEFRNQYSIGEIDENFVRGGTLGRILRESDLIEISDNSYSLATNDMCAKDGEIQGFGSHKLFRLRLFLDADLRSKIKVVVRTQRPNKPAKSTPHEVFVSPGDVQYSIEFEADAREALEIEISLLTGDGFNLVGLAVDGRFGKTFDLLANGVTTIGEFVDNASNRLNSKVQDLAVSEGSSVTYILKQGLPGRLYSGNFPGKRLQGFCRYRPKRYKSDKNVFKKAPSILQQLSLPKLDIIFDEGFIAGSGGVKQDIDKKGKAWEIPAMLIIEKHQSMIKHRVGLRYHGGEPARITGNVGYRVHARNRFGKGGFKSNLVFESPSGPDLSTLVLKHTDQIYFDTVEDYIPYSHDLALTLGKNIGALVPRHHLVELSLNGKYEGMYLAMDHFSEKTFRKWMGKNEFLAHVYKRQNSSKQMYNAFKTAYLILAETGEKALHELKKHYDINNVINSILLTVFVGDDDYCQGVDLTTNDGDEIQVTTFNWDLDHAFLTYRNEKFFIDPTMPAMRLLKQVKLPYCPRQWAFGWTYSQSKEFRNKVAARFKALMENELHPKNTIPIIDKYRAIDEIYFSNKHQQAIDDLAVFMQKRPEIVMHRLLELNREISESPPIVWH